MSKHIGVDINKPITLDAENVARYQLAVRWERKGGGHYVETVTETDARRSIDWKSVDG